MSASLIPNQIELAKWIWQEYEAKLLPEVFEVVFYGDRVLQIQGNNLLNVVASTLDFGTISEVSFQELVEAGYLRDAGKAHQKMVPVGKGVMSTFPQKYAVRGKLGVAVGNDFADDASPSTAQNSRSVVLQPSTAFIMMRMDDEQYPELAEVAKVIKEVFGSFGVTAKRADDIEHDDKITDIVLQHIRESEFLIADLSHERPNVYYEVGYAHASKKHPILYRKEGTSIHFDLAGYNVKEYENPAELRDMLTKRLEAMLGRTAK